jgi:predicted TIM-barrel fold metal-dependent hydrolase
MNPIELPPGAADCHVHVFDAERFPFAASASYHPVPCERGTVDDLAATLDAAGMERVVLVNPTSGYGDDNRCMLDALERLGRRARGIARVPMSIPDAELDALARHGVVGVRVDLIAGGTGLVTDPGFDALVAKLADRDLLLQLQGEAGQWIAVQAALARAAPVRVMVDHVGRPDVTEGVRGAGFVALLQLADTGRAAVKLSGPMRFSRRVPSYSDVVPFVDAVVRAFTPANVVFGSDWPFLRSDRRFDYGPLLAWLGRVVPDPASRATILAESPARWFGFR